MEMPDNIECGIIKFGTDMDGFASEMKSSQKHCEDLICCALNIRICPGFIERPMENKIGYYTGPLA